MRVDPATQHPTAPGSDRCPAWVPASALPALFVALAALSWGRWADPIVDFGNEPYVSWQLLEGRVLYRDLAWLFGPLPPWLNAGCFALFGASLSTLAACNLLVIAGLALIVHRFCARSADRLTATTATAVFLVSFAFPHHTEDAASYNFVWPYTYAATHGTALLVGGVVLATRAIATDRAGFWAGAGLLLGATALTKVEIALAAIAAGTTAIAWRIADGRVRRLRGPALMAAASLVPAALCAGVLGMDALLAPWEAVSRVAGGEHFNARLSGTDDVGGNLLRLAFEASLWTAVAAGLVATDLYSAGMARAPRRRAAIAAFSVVGLLLVRDLPGVGRALPVLIPIAVASLAWLARRQPVDRDRFAALVVWGVTAWTLLARMVLNIHFHHYGFYLAMPAAMLVIVLGVGVVPRLLGERTAGGGRLVRAVALATVGALAVHSIALSAASYARMSVPVGSGRDAMLGPHPDVSPTATLAVALGRRLVAQVPPDATLAILPDGTLLNFLTRRPNPTPFNEVMPPLLLAYGDERVVASYEARPPQYVVLVDWPGDEYGVGAFGTATWGAELVAWVGRRYERMDVVPASGASVGFSLWRLRA